MKETDIDIILVDDHPLVLLGTRVQLEKNGLTVKAQASNIQALGELLKEIPTAIVILDIQMPGFNLIKDFPSIHAAYPLAKFIALTGIQEPDLPATCQRLGFSGFVNKMADPEILTAGIRQVASGFSAGLNGALDTIIITHSEKNVLKLTSEGLKNHEIAAMLGVNVGTVDFHKRNLKKKLNAKTSADLIRIATEKFLY